MNFKKKVNGSWTDTPHYIHKTDTDILTTLPAVIHPTGTTATVGFKGNTLQSSIPSPTSPVMPEGTGERTAQLFDYQTGTPTAYKYLDENGNENEVSELAPWYITDYIPIPDGVLSVTLSKIGGGVPAMCAYDASKNYITGIKYDTGSAVTKVDITLTSSTPIHFIRFSYFLGNAGYDDMSTKMLNSGSTALPYKPYGYKIPITSGGNNLLDFEQLKNAPPGKIGTVDAPHLLILQMKPNTYYTIASNGYGSIDAIPADLYRSIYVNRSNGEYSVNKSNPVTVLTDDSGNVNIGFFDDRTNAQQYLNGEAQMWINEGSIPLPYEPYIEPINTNIYLGEVESTRRIKKLVLTGKETLTSGSVIGQIRTPLTGAINSLGLCTHYIIKTSYSGAFPYFRIANNVLWFELSPDGYETKEEALADFKAYLAQQYAAGTPVTVWYVLATEETAVVNEPLRKIGDYADTVSGITIPTIAGANTLSVDTTLQPSEVTVNYKGWHPVQSVHERESGAWT